MEIILLEDVKGVGKKYEEKKVSNGYASNFLIPNKLAVATTGQGAAVVKTLKEQEEKNREEKNQAFMESVSKLKNLTITTKMKANEEGHLFASLNREKISELLKKEGLEISVDNIILPELIKEIGTFEVSIAVEEKKETKFKLEVVRA